MPGKPNNERLASLEAKVDILLGLLKEIKEDVKSYPSREEYTALTQRIQKLEDSYKTLFWKVAFASGALSVVVAIIANIAKLYVK